MKTHILIFLLTVLSIKCTFSQTFQNFYHVPGGESLSLGYYITYIDEKQNGDIVVAGTKGVSIESNTNFILKLNSVGDTVFSKTIGAEGMNSCISTTDGGFLILTKGVFNYANDYHDGLIIKLDSLANIQWSKEIGINSISMSIHTNIYDAIETTNGDFILVGTTDAYGVGNSDIYIVKTDSYGNIIETKTLGDSNNDAGFFIKQDIDDNYYISGYTNSFGNGSYDIFLIKLDPTLNIIWSKTYGGTLTERPYCMEISPNNEIIITGYSNSFGTGINDIIVLQTDNQGDVNWVKTIGNTSNSASHCIKNTIDSGYILTGYFYNSTLAQLLLMKFNNNGDTIWTHAYSDSIYDIGRYICPKSNGEFIVGGTTIKDLGYGNYGYPLIFTADNNGISICKNYATSLIISNQTIVGTDFTLLNSSGGSAVSVDYPISLYHGLFNEEYCSSVNIPKEFDNKHHSINIYPNPSSGKVTIQAENIDLIEVLDLQGRKIYTGKENKIDLSSEPKGIYIIKVTTEKQVITKKLVKK